MIDNLKLAPIVIFIYKRENKFRNIINQLREIKPDQIFIVGDGPKNSDDWKIINRTRSVTKEIDWKADIKLNLSEKNLGGPTRIPTGLDWVFDHVDECIIIEDDVILDKSFFYFATLMLQKYKNNLDVANIAANTTVGMKNLDYDYFFSQQPRPWGWATWKRAWQTRIKNIHDIEDKAFVQAAHESLKHKKFANIQIESFYYQKYKRKIPNWDIFWQFNCYIKKYLTIYYKYNLAKIDGNDTYSQHKNQITTFFSKLPEVKSVEFPIKDPPFINVNQKFLEKHAFRKSKLALVNKILLIKIYSLINYFRRFHKRFKIL